MLYLMNWLMNVESATNIERFTSSLGKMGMGMLGIFIVTAIIIVCITILNRVTGKNDNNDDKK